MRVELTRELLEKKLKEGGTHRSIAKETGYSKSNIGYWISKYGLNEHSTYQRVEYKDKNYFKKIDNKNKAYLIGFILGDAYVNKKEVEITTKASDAAIVEFAQKELGGNIITDNTFNKRAHRHPRTRLILYDNTLIKDIIKHTGGTYKTKRRIPRISPALEKYLLLGFFDAEGCITWGKRKDRDRVWQKVSFTSQYKMLVGIQNILYKQVGIPSKIRPKSDGSDCYVLDFASKKAVLNFLSYVYSDKDFIILNRKYREANNLRLELGEFGGS